jgi:hypothetical protein
LDSFIIQGPFPVAAWQNPKNHDSQLLHRCVTGRVQLHLVDFDLDGVVDLLIAAPRHASVPEPEMGLPRSLGLPGAAVLFLKGKKEAAGELPLFKFPEVLHTLTHKICESERVGFRWEITSRGRFATPAESPPHDCSPC